MRGKGRRLVMKCGSMLVVKVELHRKPEMVRQPVAWMKHIWQLRIHKVRAQVLAAVLVW